MVKSVLLNLMLFVFLFFAAACTSAPASTQLSGPPTPVSTSAVIQPTAMAMDPNVSYPLTLNSTWVYQSTRYEGFNTGAVMTATSTLTETVVEVKTEPDYYAAKIRREISAETPVAGPPDLQKQLARPAETSEYWLLVPGNRIYRQEGNPDLAKLTDQDALEFQFPLNVGTRWVWLPAKLPNAPDRIGGVFRQVLKIGPIQVPAGRFDECFLIQDGWTTDTSTNWFCPGIGWVERKSDHNGTPYGSHWQLFRYQLSSHSPDPVIRYSDQSLCFTVDVPSDWTYVDGGRGGFAAFGPKDRPTINITNVSFSETDTLGRALDDLKRGSLGPYIQSTEDWVVDGRPTLWVTLVPGQEFQFVVLVIPRQCTASQHALFISAREMDRPSFEAFLKGVHLN